MRAHEFQRIGEVLRDHSGAVLGENTMAAVAVKLGPVLTEFDFPSMTHLTMALSQPDSGRLRQRVAEAVAVPESYFFRNKDCFAYIGDVMLPQLMERRAGERRLRIWSAACSTGQEPYSLAMLLAEKGRALDGWSVEIVATDFSQAVLGKAQAGQYSQFEVQRGLPVKLLIKYFDKFGPLWQVKSEIRERVDFREQNLLHSYAQLGRFDIILCRNVLIYLGADQRTSVLGRLARSLAPDGYLVLGAAETTLGVSTEFQRVSGQLGGVYRLGAGYGADGVKADRLADIDRAPAGAFRSVRLDPVTADRLEAKARACGMTLSAFLAEFADLGLRTDGDSEPKKD